MTDSLISSSSLGLTLIGLTKDFTTRLKWWTPSTGSESICLHWADHQQKKDFNFLKKGRCQRRRIRWRTRNNCSELVTPAVSGDSSPFLKSATVERAGRFPRVAKFHHSITLDVKWSDTLWQVCSLPSRSFMKNALKSVGSVSAPVKWHHCPDYALEPRWMNPVKRQYL